MMNNIKLIIGAIITLIIISGGYYISYLNSELDIAKENIIELNISNEQYKLQLADQKEKYENQIKISSELNNKLIQIQSSKEKEVKVINKLDKKHFKKAKLIENLINKAIKENNDELENIINTND